MSRLGRFALGGLGGLLPALATLVAVDLSSIATLVDKHEITEGLFVGFAIRTIGLFVLGGIVAAVNSEETAPIALLQIGIAAPALVSAYVNGALLGKTGNEANATTPTPATYLITRAYAEPLQAPTLAPAQMMPAAFLEDVVRGVTPGFNVQQTAPQSQPGSGHFSVTNSATRSCQDFPASATTSLASLQRTFPPPTFEVAAAPCPR
jgi:hypothetical protein